MPSGGTFSIEVDVAQYYRVKAAITKLNDDQYYRGLFRDTIRRILGELAEYASSITHRETGALSSAHTWEYDSHRMQGRVYIDRNYVWYGGHAMVVPPGIVQPSVVKHPWVYGPYEEARGGEHAFYRRTINERGDLVTEAALRGVVVGMSA